jgi:ferredoxin/coenzyme F420-reducing hydrogenase delta subunit
MCAVPATASIPAALARPARLLNDALDRAEAGFDRAFGARANPLRHLGAVGFLLFWIVVATGVYVYALYDTSVAGAYLSVQGLSENQPWLGGIMRSLHRYASDAFVLVMLLHVACEFVRGRYGGFRWFTWVSGVPLLWLALGSGVIGFWLVWDDVALFSAVATMEWLDALGLFGEPLGRNFLTADSVDDRFFSLLAFLHIGVPLLLLLGMWVHIQRLSRPDTQADRRLGWGTLAVLVALAIVLPVVSEAPADPARAAQSIALDWFYLAPHVVMYQTSPVTLWIVSAAATVLLAACPALQRAPRAAVAVVDPANCNGCSRCFADCPYGAITMQPHPDARVGARMAAVSAELCAGCGICAGACPSSTPFRSIRELVSGIDMPQLPIGALRDRLSAELARLSGAARVIVFGCDHGADVRGLQAADTAAISLLCAGQLPPAFVEYALRRGADAVLVVACPEDGCAFRHGGRWTEERLLGQREPYLRERIPAQSWRLIKAGHSDAGRLHGELKTLRAGLRAKACDSGAVHA